MNWEGVEAARNRARSLFCFAGFTIVSTFVLLIAVPPEPSFGPTPPWEHTVLPVGIGIGGIVFGLAWMWRIYKAPTKHEGAHWRFRDHP
jgi:hypothetical protein